MKNFYILLIACVMFVSCRRGYNCNNGVCEAVTRKATYKSLVDCKSDCEMKRGKVKLTIEFQNSPPCDYFMNAGIGFTSHDVVHGIYINGGVYGTSPVVISQDDLKPGIYYYRAQKTPASYVPPLANCKAEIKSGVFEIKPEQETVINLKF